MNKTTGYIIIKQIFEQRDGNEDFGYVLANDIVYKNRERAISEAERLRDKQAVLSDGNAWESENDYNHVSNIPLYILHSKPKEENHSITITYYISEMTIE